MVAWTINQYFFQPLDTTPNTSSFVIRNLIRLLVMDIILPLTMIPAKPFNHLQVVQFDTIPRIIRGLNPIGLIL
jgi:hypothetical protein